MQKSAHEQLYPLVKKGKLVPLLTEHRGLKGLFADADAAKVLNEMGVPCQPVSTHMMAANRQCSFAEHRFHVDEDALRTKFATPALFYRGIGFSSSLKQKTLPLAKEQGEAPVPPR